MDRGRTGTTRTIGRCSICDGDVTVPMIWGGVQPARPSCDSCGAVQKNNAPVVDMVEPEGRRSVYRED